jgi:hypothetical protein
MCKNRPCWPTPDEARKLIEAGYAKKLMLDWYVASPDIYVLTPAVVGHEGDLAPSTCMGWPQCCLLKNNRCEIHGELKPLMAKHAHHDTEKYGSASLEEIAKLWDNEEGRALIKRWKKLVDVPFD